MRLSSTGRRYELVEGELYETAPAGGRHGKVAIRIGILLGAYILENRLGEAFAAETGFILRRDPDTVRAPDFALVSIDRLPPEGPPVGFVEMAPDLAVEVGFARRWAWRGPGQGGGLARGGDADGVGHLPGDALGSRPPVKRERKCTIRGRRSRGQPGSARVFLFGGGAVLLGIPYPALPFLRLRWRV